ncbi:MAG: LuxR C-terminal-related transcriptional regulator [Actinomycetota bacterium]
MQQRTPMFVRTDDLAAALRFITSGSCVSIVGPDGSGRSLLLAELGRSLEQRGYRTVPILGLESLHSRAFEALDLAGELPKSSSSVGNIVAGMAERATATRSVLLIDDAQFVDDPSWGVIAAVHARTGAIIVATSSGTRHGGGRRLHTIINQAAELRLRPLTFEAVSDLVHDQLSGPVDTALVGRIYTKSAGIPSLAMAMVTSARSFGHIVSVDGTWTSSGTLWHDSMSGAVEHLLARVDDELRDAVETLALAGVVDVETAGELVGRERVETLEALDLLLSIEPFGRQSVTVTPPLVSDYFQNMPTSVRRTRILQHVQRQFGQEGSTTRPELLPVSASDASLEPDAAEIAVLRLIRDRHAAQLSARRHAWERDPTADTAIHYLFALFDGAHARTDALAVFERTETGDSDGGATAQFRILHAWWLALAAGDITEALATLATAAATQPRYATMFEVWATQLEIVRHGTTTQQVERLATLRGRDATTAASITSVHATALVLRGRAESAAELLGNVDDTSTKIGRVLALLRGWSMFARGDLTAAHDWAIMHIEQSRIELDLENLRGHTYLAAVAAITLGRFRTAEVHLGRFLALGEPGLGQEGTQMGALALASMLAARAGRVSSAESLAAQAAATGVTVGPWPGMVAALPDIARALLAADTERAGLLVREQVTLLHDRGYLLAAAVLPVLLMGTGSALLPTDGEDDPVPEGDLISPVHRMYTAIEREDPDELERLSTWFESRGRVEHAIISLDQARSIANRRGDEGAAGRFSDALAAVRASRDPLDAPPAIGRSTAQAQLSNRELEVARLAAHGLSNHEIALRLHVSHRTVESHLLKAFRKLQISGRAELVTFSWS